MDRETLKRYKPNKRELAILEKRLARKEDELDKVETVSGKVTKSGDDFPYIEEHMAVQMQDPKAASPIKVEIRKMEKRRDELLKEQAAVEEFIRSIPDGVERQVFEMVFLDGINQSEAGQAVGYTQGRISQMIKNILSVIKH